ncbi:MAG TPA: monovalent cation/H+ antiporter subunit D family protein [Candidatus Methanoculleus thermohydrogenotrophicum]|jgi:multicomponent Na+:H+ antiporter subunit D|nr:monovalent cation/H+ antiporter subunit D family protein [Candidatus Methanoculleus thermohydrogenotrophicum]NLM82133.1 monovalent cation/H+ antiporter subunit D family protein [Candidatus Methanoculleus thermohydrogenotrophicum]HOB17188.1 monovalent cation/H+ antiporter subunit D family protein [Candidatus Methanoculleus thermohydrogenotrophicum]HPZ37267.1 monovalent cation/H+ antiporter subunit D family protein [Candidatus Methanoculleus thermohydrogenotrophicum]HQC90519.1 monovalent catio
MTVIDHLPVLLIAIPILASLLILLVGWHDRRFCYPISLITVLSQFGAAIIIFLQVMREGTVAYHLGSWAPPFGIELLIDSFNGFILMVILLLSAATVIYARRSVESEIEPEKTVPFYVLFQLLVTGLVGMTITGDIFNLYVFLEISSIAAYALIASAQKPRAYVASFNYLILGSIAGGFALIGIGNLYVATGTLNMLDLARLLPASYELATVHAAFLFLVIGFSIKAAFFPLHLWLPDAYAESPSAVTVLISTVMSKVSVYALLRIVFSIFTTAYIFTSFPVNDLILFIATVAIIAGAILAIAQDNLKRLLAYSSVSQIGYIMFALGVSNQVALEGGILHILGHALMKGCLFMVAGLIIYRMGTASLKELGGLSKAMPISCAAFALAGASMIGIPPTIGFMSKYYLVLGALEADHWIYAGALLIGSLLAVGYIWRFIEIAYFKDNDHDEGHRQVRAREGPVSMLLPMVVLALLCLFLGIFVEGVMEAVTPAATLLLGGA